MCLFCWCEPVKVSTATPNCCPVLLDPYKHTCTIRWDNHLFFLELSFDSEDVNTGNWIGSELCIICKARHCHYIQDGSWFAKSDKDMAFIHHYFPHVSSYIRSLWQPTICKLKTGLVTLQQSNCRCSRMLSQPIRYMLYFINQVMLQLTNCLQKMIIDCACISLFVACETRVSDWYLDTTNNSSRVL